MVKSLYGGPIKEFSEKIGFHSYLQQAYNEAHPYRFVKTFDRQQLREHADKIYSFSTAEEIKIPPANTGQGEKHSKEFDKVVGSYTFEQPFVAEIRNGYILEKTGLATANDYTIPLDAASSREGKIKWRLDRESLLDLVAKQHVGISRNSTTTTLDTAVSLIRSPFQPPAGRTNLASKGYSHWVLCYLTLIQGIEAYQEQTGKRPTIVIEPDPPSWLRESLFLFGYDTDDIHFWNPSERLRVNRLVVPSVRRVERPVTYDSDERGAQYKLLSPDACQWVRKTAIERCPEVENEIEYSPKVFVSREDADRRRIQNRDTVLETLRQKGFKSYELSSLSFEQQVKLFSQAEKVIGVHGAGLANIIFSSNCSVVEIFPEQFKPTYYLLAHIQGLDYKAVSGEIVHQPGVKPIHQDTSIDIEKYV